MRKIKFLLVGLFVLFGATLVHASPISVDQFIVTNDVTLAHLEDFRAKTVGAINSMPGDNLQNDSITADALDDNANPELRWGRAFNDWVYTGLLPATDPTLTSNISSGSAFIKNTTTLQQKLVQKDATAHTYTSNRWTFVDLSVDGTYTFIEQGHDTAEPAITSNSLRMARVSTDVDNINNVRDDRTTSITLGSNQEDFQRNGLGLTVQTPDVVTVDSGIAYHGTTRISKISDTTLNLSSASDWATGVSGRATSTDGYVALNSTGSLKLTTTAPTVSDTSSNTAGKLRYSSINGVLWRIMGWFHMNNSGSGNIDNYTYSNISENGMVNSVMRSYKDVATTTTTIPLDDSVVQHTEGEQFMVLAIVPTQAGKKIRVEAQLQLSHSIAGAQLIVAGFNNSETESVAVGFATQKESTNVSVRVPLMWDFIATSNAEVIFRIRAGSSAGGTTTVNGQTGARLFNISDKSFIKVTELE